MAVQFSITVRNARLDMIETTIGASPTMEIRTLAPPATCATADVGVVLATIALPPDWMLAAASGSKAISGGPWQDLTADAAGLAAHFRIKAGATCHLQGTVGQGTGDLQLDNATIAAGQTVSITSFTLTDANA